MIFAFYEDGGIYTYDTPDMACLAYEGVDVESEIVCFFDEFGCPMKPVFDTPNEYRKFLWFFKWSNSGKYHLEADASFEIEPLALLLHEAQYVDENSVFDSVDEIRARLLPGQNGKENS